MLKILRMNIEMMISHKSQDKPTFDGTYDPYHLLICFQICTNFLIGTRSLMPVGSILLRQNCKGQAMCLPIRRETIKEKQKLTETQVKDE